MAHVAGAELLSIPHRLERIGRRAFLGVAAGMLAGSVGLAGFRLAYMDQILPGVLIGTVNVGGMNYAEAEETLAHWLADLDGRLVTFSYRNQTFSPAFASLGVTFDLKGSLDSALAVGRGSTSRNNLVDAADLIRTDQVVPLKITIDSGVLGAWLNEAETEIAQTARNAELVLEGANVIVREAVDGIGLDHDAVRAVITDALMSLEPSAKPLPVAVVAPDVSMDALTPLRERAEAVLADTVTIRHDGETWTVTPDDIATFLRPGTNADSAPVLHLDKVALTAWVAERFQPLVSVEPVNAKLAWNNGLTVVTPETPGRELDANTLAEELAESFLDDHRAIDVPTTTVAAEVAADKLDELGIKTLIAMGNSTYTGSTVGRATNVEVGVASLNGTLIAPGAEFSFNGAIGDITADKGYVEEQVIVAERIGRDIGGGICQVSTTMFRAAVRSGCTISDWTPHYFRVPFYELNDWDPGWDAAIFQPSEPDQGNWVDLRFRNSTDHWLLIQSWADGAEAHVAIYGQDIRWDVKLSKTEKGAPIQPPPPREFVDEERPPGSIEQTEWETPGVETWFGRDVYDGSELIDSRRFYSRLEARGNVWWVSPDQRGRSPAGAS